MPLIFILLGYWIRYRSILRLKNNYTSRITIPDKLVKDGIYSIIRHPCYSGWILMVFGMTWLSTNIWMGLVMIYILLSIARERAEREEELLFRIFKEEYKEYYKKTKMFIPFVL